MKQKQLEEKNIPSARIRLYSVEDVLVVHDEMFQEMTNPMIEIKPFQHGPSGKKKEHNIDMLNNEYFYKTEDQGKTLSGLFNGDNSPIKLDRIKSLVMLEAVMIFDTLIEGNDKIPSFLGIPK